jgi:hypothetical protein
MEQSSRSTLEVRGTAENEDAKNLLTARGTIWGKESLDGPARRAFPSSVDGPIEKHKTAVEEDVSLRSCCTDGVLAADLDKIISATRPVRG